MKFHPYEPPVDQVRISNGIRDIALISVRPEKSASIFHKILATITPDPNTTLYIGKSINSDFY